MSLETVAIRRNLMTIKQVARFLTLQEAEPDSSFLETAIQEKLIDKADSERLLHEQQASSPSLPKLLIECGLLTQRQTEVLFNHFEKQMATGLKSQLPAVDSAAESISNADEVQAPTVPSFSPPQPKFSQRPAATKVFNTL